MPAASESVLGLAATLRALPDSDLAQLLAARGVRGSGIRDFFDLAEALLQPESLRDAVARLTIHESVGLGTGDAAAVTRGRELGLVIGGDGVPAEVRELLPSRIESAPPTLVPVSAVESAFTDRVAAERAFTTTGAVASLVAVLQREPARELAKGGIALPDTRRLADALGIEFERVAAVLDLADRAGLAALDGGRWMPTARSDAWLVTASADRWSTLAAAWLDRLPPDIRATLGERAGAVWGDELLAYLDWLYPSGGEWMRERVIEHVRAAELLGIVVGDAPSTPGTALLTSGVDAAAAAMAALFPPSVEQVYLQHDLSIVSPGPLAPRLDVRLRAMADAEGGSLASSYRVSAGSLTRAYALGETEEGIREFLRSISLTGIPQPLDYLLRETAVRFGLVRVRADEFGSRVHSSDATVLRTIAVDQSLAHLGFVEDPPLADADAAPWRRVASLRSSVDRDVVFWTLADHRYPVAAEDRDGAVVAPERFRASGEPANAPGPAAALIERLREADAGADEQAWMTRQLDLAIRGKLTLTVTVAMPGGGTADYELEPASVAGGRLRARDRRADLERTLPLSSIVAVVPREGPVE